MHSSKWTRRLGLAVLAGGIIHGSVGCAQERDPINRVQANAMSKHFFGGVDLASTSDDPEFYMRNTVIDVPYGAAQDGLFTATYAQPLNRVKWEISEKALLARMTYERIQDSDHHGARRTNNGQVVAMFTIESHFDIRRSYNSTTGEELNVIEENTTDRPWYQREFFRVDWSKNLVTDGYLVDTLSMIGIFGGIQWDPMSYYVSDPNDANAPQFSETEGYFDVTTKAFATPQTFQNPEQPSNKVAYCMYATQYGGTYPIGNCNPTEVTLRLSFRAVTDNDYEAVDWTGTRMDAFGWFTEDRLGYERNYGVLDETWHRFAAKYNIWQQSHISDGAVEPAQRQYAQCAVDTWRDANGNVQKYKVQGGSVLLSQSTLLPVPTTADDPEGLPYAWTKVGADVHADANHDGTEDECEVPQADGSRVPYPGHEGARCDEFANRCSLPLRSRALKTIPWYYGPQAPADLFASTAKALGQWNLAVKNAAQLGKMVDAKRIGADASAILTGEAALAQDNGATVPDVFVLCHNPTIDDDHPACRQVTAAAQSKCQLKTDANTGDDDCNWGGPKDAKGNRRQVSARLGDIRYNLVNIIDTPQTPSPWGIMVDANDPLTGEKVVTSVNEWGHVLDIKAQETEDLLRWINGEITDAQITSGAYLRDWAAASQLGAKAHMPSALGAGEVKSRIASLDTSMAKMNGLTAGDATLPLPLRRQKAATTLANAYGGSMDGQLEAFRLGVIGTPFEAQAITGEWLQAAGYDPSTPVAGNDAALSAASPLRGMNPLLRKRNNHLRGKMLAEAGACVVEQPEPDALVGLARQAARLYPLPAANGPDYPALKNKRDAALHQWIREQFHVAVIAHEMGHSMGLRHNFTGSFDALNYHPEYWQLRTRNGKEHFCTQDAVFSPQGSTLDATTPHPDGACVGPRWVDPVTDTEVSGLIWKWGSSTVMDYPGDQTQDMNDIGPYDKAAMRFGYADVVDVDNDAYLPKAEGDGSAEGGRGSFAKGGAYLVALDGFGGIGGHAIGGYHYSQYNDKFHILRTCSEPTNAADPLTARCDGFDLDYVSLRDMVPAAKFGQAVLDIAPFTAASFAVWVPPPGQAGDAKARRFRVRHPYMFGSDEYADSGNVPVFRFDAGADSYEQFQFIISTYENRYIFDNFRRDRTTFNSGAVIARAMDRYFDKVQGMTKSLALLVGLDGDSALSDPGGLMPLALGASDGLAMFARIMTRPEPGAYQIQASSNGASLDFAQTPGLTLQPGAFSVALGSGEGRYLHNDYDYTQGYWWSDYQSFAGTSYEKHMATYYLTEAYNYFLSNAKDDYIDGRYKNLNYASIYPNQVRRLFSQILQNDPMTCGPYVVKSANAASKDGVWRVQYLPWEKYDAADAATTALNYPSDAVVLDPLVGWEQQYRTLINLFWFGRTTLTMDVIDQLRIFTPGGTDAVTLQPNEQIRFADPLSGIIYYARTYGREIINPRAGAVEKSMGARMLQYANKLAAQTFMVHATDEAGQQTYEKDASGQYVCADASLCVANKAKLQAYVANLDVVRQLTKKYGYGPLDLDP
jgi:hypothetical protein